MTREEIKQMANTCDNYYGCGCCPYNPEDISRFIGDKWKGGCPNYDRKLVYAMGKGYGDVSEYEAEIDRLEAENERLTERLKQVLLSIDTVKEMNAMCNIDDHRKQAVKEFADEIKDYINNKVEEEYGDMSDSVNYITIDIDEFETFIDNLLEEQNGKDKD